MVIAWELTMENGDVMGFHGLILTMLMNSNILSIVSKPINYSPKQATMNHELHSPPNST
jgi:hypothetical protein